MTCTHEGDASGQPCGLPAQMFFGYPMCTKHRSELLEWKDINTARQVHALVRREELAPARGYTYVLLLTSRRVKIGYTGGGQKSGGGEKLHERLREACRKYPVLDIMSMFDEGWTKEQVLHYDLKADRIYEDGEVFHLTPEVLDAIRGGVTHPRLDELSDYIASYNLKLQS